MVGLRLAITSLLVAAATASAATGAIAVTVRDAATGLLLPGAETSAVWTEPAAETF